MTDEIIKALTSSWLNTANEHLARLERYYHRKQSMRDNGMFTRADLADPVMQRLFKPVNIVALVVDEPVADLASGKVTIVSNDGNARVEAWASDYFRRRIRGRMDELVRWQGLYGESYLYLWTDREGRSRGLKTMALAPVNGGAPRVLADYGGEDPEELTAAVLFSSNPLDLSGGVVEYRAIVTAELIRVDKRERKKGEASSLLTRDWQQVRETPNPAGVVPVIPVWNDTPSDVENILQAQDDYDKLLVSWRSAEEYVGFPTWAVNGQMNPNEPLNVGPNQVLTGGEWSVLQAPSIQPFIDRRGVIFSDAAALSSSIKLSDKSGVAVSGVALQYLQRGFTSKLEGKARLLGNAIELALWTAARILAEDAELFAIETANLKEPPTPADLAAAELSVTLQPNVPADAKADAETASIWFNDLGVSQETALGRAGVENPQEEIERANAEAEAQRQPRAPAPGELDPADEADAELEPAGDDM